MSGRPIRGPIGATHTTTTMQKAGNTTKASGIGKSTNIGTGMPMGITRIGETMTTKAMVVMRITTSACLSVCASYCAAVAGSDCGGK